MCRKLLALILMVIFIAEALPLQALADTEQFLLPQEEIDRYVMLYGLDEQNI